MKIEQIQQIIEVAQVGSINRASQNLYCTKHIKQFYQMCRNRTPSKTIHTHTKRNRTNRVRKNIC
jgi:hypothetical protein